MDKFGGSSGHFSRLNFHVIFSDDLAPEILEQQFLNALSSKYTLSPQYPHLRGEWHAVPTRESLADLGQKIIDTVPLEERQHFGAPLVEGFNNLCLSLEAIQAALEHHYFADKFVTAIGKTEWSDIKWNDHSIADKKNIINGVDFVFIASDSPQHWASAKKALVDAGVNARLLDCSDAHYFRAASEKDRVGHCFTWVKADSTFSGLRQLIVEPDERIWIGDLPPQLERVRTNPTKYIDRVEIKRKADATITETWFDNSIPLNPGLVAIIGNKGKGKSAFTDIIGLAGNTRQHREFTFLSLANFRHPRHNKARHFQVTLTLASGTLITRSLDESVDERQPELVKYIPQNFLEKICTQIGAIEESDFDRELKKVIFSHVERPQRLGKSCLDDIIEYRTEQAADQGEILRQELHKINAEIVALEDKSDPAHRKRVENLQERKRKELEAHDHTKPAPIAKPETDAAAQAELSEVTAAIDTAKDRLNTVEAKIAEARRIEAALAYEKSTAERVSARLSNLERQIGAFLAESEPDFSRLGLTRADVIRVEVNFAPVTEKLNAIARNQQTLEVSLDPTNADGLEHARAEIETRIQELQSALDEPNKRFQAREAAIRTWKQRRLAIIGDADTPDTFTYYEAQIADLDTIPGRLDEARARRLEKAQEIHAVICALGNTYRDLYAPVNRFIETRPLARDKFQLNFEVAIVDTGFQDTFFDFISQSATGTFSGIERGNKALRDILARQNFQTSEGVATFLSEIDEALRQDQRPNGRAVKVSDQLRKGKNPLALYNFVFALAYLKPRYALRMGTKELAELSPGERGTLLLVFYLLVDKDDIPLVIDQPEENLDNQTVYELIVPCMKEAKQRRQVLIVTHNPNLAVVCDAEQIICADLDKAHNHRMTYISGAIESPSINNAIVDILEGTMPAFHNRESKYLQS